MTCIYTWDHDIIYLDRVITQCGHIITIPQIPENNICPFCRKNIICTKSIKNQRRSYEKQKNASTENPRP
jgi:hypothetical protein